MKPSDKTEKAEGKEKRETEEEAGMKRIGKYQEIIAMCNGSGPREGTAKAGSAPLPLLDLSKYPDAGVELAKSYCGSI